MEDRYERLIVRVGIAVLAIGMVLRGWDDVVRIVGAILAASAPLLVGAVIAYIVNILMSFLERHLLPRSTFPLVTALRRPVCLAVSFLLIVSFVMMTVSLLVPALIESFDVIGVRVKEIAAWLKDYKPAQPLISSINSAISGDVLDTLSRLDVTGFLRQGVGDIMAPLTEQLTVAVMSAATFFFGLLFSIWLLLDKGRVGAQLRRFLVTSLGEGRYGRVAYVCGTLDHCYHGYIVRQCAEAIMLGIVSMALLTISGFPYASGVSSLVVFASLIPVVGIPTGIGVGAFLVLTDKPIFGIVFLVAMFLSQALIETFVMPHVGDPRIVLSPVWITVAVTLGGGLFGFFGMVTVTPLAAAAYQLLRAEVEQREQAKSLTPQ